MRTLIVVKATFDVEAGVWFTESTDIPGLRLEAESLEMLQLRIPGAILDLLEESHDDEDGDNEGECHDVPVEIIAHASTRVRIRADA